MYFLKNAKWNKGLCITGIFILCAIVSVLMFGLNTLQTIALEQELRCDIEEHVHTDNCYEGDFLVCPKQAHLHDGNCYLVLLHDNDINSVFDNMKCGVRYRLTETVAPEGYLKLEEYIYFTINEDGSVTVEDSYYAEAGTTAYNIIVRNVEGIELPESGGTGTGMLYTMAMLLFMATAGIYINHLRKRRCYN